MSLFSTSSYFLFLLCFPVPLVAFSRAATQKNPDVTCSGMETESTSSTVQRRDYLSKEKMLQNGFSSFQGNHVNDSSSFFLHRGRGAISCYPPFPSLGWIRISKCHHTSTSPTGSSVLLPFLSVLSLITESGKPFSLPSINIPAFIFIIVS